MRTIFLIPLLVGAALVSALALPAAKLAGGPRVGDTAPPLEVELWRNQIGRAPSLADLRGHAVLVEFWATW